jgi:histone H4
MSQSVKATKTNNPNKVKKPREVMRDSILGITNPAIKRLAHRAGIPRVGKLSYDAIRAHIQIDLQEIIKQVAIALQHTGSKTVKTKHVEFALRGIDPRWTIAVHYEKGDLGKKAETHRKSHTETNKDGKKPHKFRAGVEVLRDIRRMQKSEDPIFPAYPFNRLVRELMQDHLEDIRYEARALGLLRLYIEDCILKLLQNALMCALSDHRITLDPRDISLAKTIANSA